MFGVTGQSLVLDVREGRPSSVTSVTVYAADADDNATAESATTGSASVETDPNTLIASAAGASQTNPKAITVSGAGVLVGRRYWIESDFDHKEEIEFVSFFGASGTLRHPLVNDYALGSALFTTRCSVSLDSTWVADESNLSVAFAPSPAYRVRWVVVVGGATQVYDQYFDLVRYPARHRVSALDVENLSPGWIDRLPVDARADQGRGLIDRAWAHVKWDLFKAGIGDSALRNAALLHELVASRAVLVSLEDQALAGAAIDLAAGAQIYDRRFAGLIETPRAPVDRSGGGASTAGERSRPVLLR